MGLGITIYDIAEEASVSIATVSRVLNNRPRVSATTRLHVMEVADRLGYQPHPSARSLASQQTNVIAAVIPMMTSYFYLEVMRGIQNGLAQTGYDLMVYAPTSPEEADSHLDGAMNRGRADGILLLSTPLNASREERLTNSGQAVVLVDTFHPAFDTLLTDNVLGGRLATEFLLQKGYKRIGLLSASRISEPARRRHQGYSAALQAAGIAANPALEFWTEHDAHHGFTEEAGFTGMQSLLTLSHPPDAVFAVSDIQALGALRALREAGRTDIALLGFDDIIISRYVGLSTVQQPMSEMGHQAVNILLNRIHDPSAKPTQRIFSPKIVERDTTPLAA